jgi:DNA recombination protein RmuC
VQALIVAVAALACAALAGVWLGVAAVRRSVDVRLGAAGAELRRLADSNVHRDQGTDAVRRELSTFRESVQRMAVREGERRVWEEQTWETLHRVAAVLAGAHRTGMAGENVLREALSHLPPSMLVTDFRVGGRVVEFGLVLPDGRRLPIDSKWTAERELAALADAPDPPERDRLTRVIERAVADRAREVSGYLDGAITAPVGVAAVPDAAYAVLRRAHADAFRQGVVVVSYSMALPVLLFLYGMASRFGALGDMEACLAELAACVDAMEGTLENKVVRASTMLANGAEEVRGQLGKARASIARARGPVMAGAKSEDRPKLIGLAP